jgi:8-oxo-dGTP pyrophosphatase MutT (NUDIX family)
MRFTVESVRCFFQSFHRSIQENSELTSAAVLMLLFEKDDQLSVILTKRTNSVQHHKGQISFPGGTKDDDDATVTATALRETEEEIGISKNTIEILGLYNDFITPSGFCVTPVVAYLPSRTTFSLNPSEVSEVFDVPLSFFLNNQNEQVDFHLFNGIERPVYSYSYGTHEIWGATAVILRSFLLDLTVQNGWKKTL